MSSALYQVLLICTILNIDTRAYGDVRFLNKCIFSTKTPYFWIKSNDEVVTEDSEAICNGPDKTKLTKSCVSFHINSLIRHGIRYPGLKWIKHMDEVQQKLTKAIIRPSSQSGFIEKWANPFPNEKEHALAPSGKSELFELGKRFGQRFKMLLEVETEKVQYFVSSKERTFDSRRAFHDGLISIFSTDVIGDSCKVPIIDDNILRFHSGCKKYLDQIENNDTALGEYFKFKNGPEMNSVVNDVKKRIVDDVDVIGTINGGL
ncbi:Multiple inositol polyphosphate phosphatase 1 [Mizuhopecten yessoensis]|uniref:Multiple inositol polyphosphate phosphatase 1 n=1 Tax=Mizuhopecten yessoensis TaxID=6573 RepID=A0A210PDQ1_MIZYE|nr:Multiple inositol polyphosphate phosphatase 1 [Mizuhopecten yessoensis]